MKKQITSLLCLLLLSRVSFGMEGEYGLRSFTVEIEGLPCPASGLNQLDHDLFHSLMNQQEERAVQLIQSGANVDVSLGGGTFLHIASLVGDEKSVKILVNHKANIDKFDRDGFSPLDLATLRKHGSIVDFLLTRGAHVALKTLFIARSISRDSVLHDLLQGCFLAQESQTLQQRNSVLLDMAKAHNVPALIRALAVGANPDSVNERRNTALHFASSFNNQRAAEALLRYHARVDMQNEKGNTPLHFACWKGHEPMAERLLKASAPVDVPNSRGDRPLHLASWWGHLGVVQRLVEQFPSLSATNNEGKTPLDLAKTPEIKSCLQETQKAYAILSMYFLIKLYEIGFLSLFVR